MLDAMKRDALTLVWTAAAAGALILGLPKTGGPPWEAALLLDAALVLLASPERGNVLRSDRRLKGYVEPRPQQIVWIGKLRRNFRRLSIELVAARDGSPLGWIPFPI